MLSDTTLLLIKNRPLPTHALKQFDKNALWTVLLMTSSYASALQLIQHLSKSTVLPTREALRKSIATHYKGKHSYDLLRYCYNHTARLASHILDKKMAYAFTGKIDLIEPIFLKVYQTDEFLKLLQRIALCLCCENLEEMDRYLKKVEMNPSPDQKLFEQVKALQRASLLSSIETMPVLPCVGNNSPHISFHEEPNEISDAKVEEVFNPNLEKVEMAHPSHHELCEQASDLQGANLLSSIETMPALPCVGNNSPHIPFHEEPNKISDEKVQEVFTQNTPNLDDFIFDGLDCTSDGLDCTSFGTHNSSFFDGIELIGVPGLNEVNLTIGNQHDIQNTLFQDTSSLALPRTTSSSNNKYCRIDSQDTELLVFDDTDTTDMSDDEGRFEKVCESITAAVLSEEDFKKPWSCDFFASKITTPATDSETCSSNNIEEEERVVKRRIN